MMSNYIRQNGRSLSLGADAAPASTSSTVAFQTAMAAANASDAQYLVVFIDRNGDVSNLKSYGSRAELNADWDDNIVNKLPADTALALRMDKVNQVDGAPEIDQTVNPLIGTMTITTSKINWSSAAPWILGGAALIALAIYYKKKKPGKARRRAGWRRRTVTVWR